MKEKIAIFCIVFGIILLILTFMSQKSEGNYHPYPQVSSSPNILPSSTPQPSVSSTPIPSTSPSPSLSEKPCKEDCDSPTYSPPEYKPSVCTVALPEAVTPRYESMSPTQVKLLWDADDTNTTHWSISFGYSKDNLHFGTGNLPKEAREYTVSGLDANSVKWFELSRWNGSDCRSIGLRIDP